MSVLRNEIWRRASRTWMALVVLALVPAAAGAQTQATISVDYGVIGLSSLSILQPSQFYRPIDDLAIRPGGDAQGMGGAYLARAQGPLAIGWEPAGLAYLDHTSAVLDGVQTSASSTSKGYPDSLLSPGNPAVVVRSADNNLKGGPQANFLAAATPLWHSDRFHLVGGLSWRRFLDTSMPEQTVMTYAIAGTPSSIPVVLSMDRSEKGGVESFAPSLGLRIGRNLAVGANLNFLTGRLLCDSQDRLATGATPLAATSRIEFKYRGFAPDLGIRVTGLSDRLEFGAKITPGYTLEVRDGSFSSQGFALTALTQVFTTGQVAAYNMDIPAAFGVGVAYRPFPRLWLSSDVNVHHWSQTTISYQERPEDLASEQEDALQYQDVSTFHIGAEYILFQPSWGTIPVRIGFHTSPQSFRNVSPADVKVDTLVTPDGSLLALHPSGSFNGSQVSGNTLTVGASIRFKTISYDLGVESLSYKQQEWYFDSPLDPLINPGMNVVSIDRHVLRLHISATYDF